MSPYKQMLHASHLALLRPISSKSSIYPQSASLFASRPQCNGLQQRDPESRFPHLVDTGISGTIKPASARNPPIRIPEHGILATTVAYSFPISTSLLSFMHFFFPADRGFEKQKSGSVPRP
jgi:hypothetical protein